MGPKIGNHVRKKQGNDRSIIRRMKKNDSLGSILMEKKKSKHVWLKEGDDNTKLFHMYS
jgi:hypothetical protein